MFLTVLKLAVSKKEKLKDYPWVETQVNSEVEHINVTHVMTYFASGSRRGCRWWWGSSVAIHAFFIRSRSRRMIRVRVSRWKLSFLFSIFKSLKATKVQGMMLTMVVTCTQSYICQVIRTMKRFKYKCFNSI